MKRAISIFLLLAMMIPMCSLGAGYTDVPANSWAKADIAAAGEAKIMEGRGNGIFGYGDKIMRSEFAAMLTRLMGWSAEKGETSRFADVKPAQWYTGYINTLYTHGVENGKNFRPDAYITRREMAVMLVKALGYDNLAKSEKTSPFSDVTADKGYISVAYNLGIINGTGGDKFDPEGSATREQGAAMMMRVHRKYYAKIDEIHGFYAISSWNQREIAASMDEVSFGWARLEYDNGVSLNQTSKNGNDWKIPQGYGDALKLMRDSNTAINLAVTMTDQSHCKAILLDEANRLDAVRQIVSAAKEFDGVTIDFEGMKGDELKDGLTTFMEDLRAALGGKRLNIAVHPVLSEGEYFNAYDYGKLGEICHKIILMAHDYAPNNLPSNLMNTDFIATPVTPFGEVYHGLKRITDEVDSDKITLALSVTNTAAWNARNKRITEGKVIHPSMETVAQRLSQADTEVIYSDTYRNPYAWYNTEGGQQILLWYEDARSIADKIELAKMFGITDISVWRIGAIPNGSADTYMNIWDTIDNMR